MIIHVLEANLYDDPVLAFFIDLELIDESSPKDLQEYKRILQDAVNSKTSEVSVHHKLTLSDGYYEADDGAEISFSDLCSAEPPCYVEASIRVDMYR